MLVGVHVSKAGSYRPPPLMVSTLRTPPQTIISLPVQTAVWLATPPGVLVVRTGVQVSVVGWYLPPVLSVSS